MAVTFNSTSTTFGAAAQTIGPGTLTAALPTTISAVTGDMVFTWCVVRSTTPTATVNSPYIMLGPFSNTTTPGVRFYVAYAPWVSGIAAPVWTMAGGSTGTSGTDWIVRSYFIADAASLGTPGTLYAPSATGTTIGPITGVPVAAGGAAVVIGAQSDDFGTPVAPTGWQSMGAQEAFGGGDVSILPFFRASSVAETSPDVTITAAPTAAAIRVGVQIPILETVPAVSSFPMRHPIVPRLPLLVR